jgi:hypothetical protein
MLISFIANNEHQGEIFNANVIRFVNVAKIN